MQGAAFDALKIDAEYLLYDIAPEDVDEFLKAAPSKGIKGLNVTIPHKIKAKEYIEKNGTLDETAKKLGAVNTIKVGDDGRLCGYNTDGPGFYRSLVEDLKFEPEGKNIFVLGAGGASTAIVMYLGNAPKSIRVSDIDNKKLDELQKHYEKHYGRNKLFIVSGNIGEALAGSDLLVNTTPVGLKADDPSPINKSLLRPGLRVYDLIYNRPVTQLVKEANQSKAHAVTGLGMFLYQGTIAFEIWTDKKAPVAVMRKALRDAIRNID